MFFYVLRRLIGAIMLLIVMSLVTFLLFYAAPNDPARLTCGRNCTATGIEQNRKYLGLDKPLTTQYFAFVGGFVHSREFPDNAALQKSNPELINHCSAPCLGYSQLRHTQIGTFLKSRIPITIFLSLGAFMLWIVGGVLLGIVAALRKGKIADRVIVSSALVAYSFPTFFLSLLLLEVVVFQLHILQTPVYVSPTVDFGGFLYNLILPCVTLALVYAAAYVRITRTYMLETMNEDYLRTARAKGLKRPAIIFKHTFRAALTPIVTIAGLDLGALLAGAPITESIFGFQGVGNAAVQASVQFDLPMVSVIVLLSAAFVIIANLVVDVLYGFIDPRVRY